MASLRTRLAVSLAGLLAPIVLAAALYLGKAQPTTGPVWGAAGIFLSAVGLTYLLARHYLRPLEELLPVVAAAARGETAGYVSILTNDELGALAGHINTILRRWQESLRQVSQEKEQLNAVLTSMGEGVLAVDPAGQMLLVNPAAKAMLGLEGPEPAGRPLLAVARHHELYALVETVLRTGEPLEKEMRLQPAGERVYRVSAVPIREEGGRQGGAVLVLRDVTQSRELEKMRSEFVANVSHELRTPLTSIRGFAETLREGAVEDPPVRDRFLSIIVAEANRLQRLLDDLLTLAYVENRQVQLKVGRAQVEAVVAEVVDLLGPLAEAKKLELRSDLGSPLPPVSMHPDYLRQTLVNLVDNAIKYTPPGGKVEIVARARDEVVQVEVRDTGVGIPAEALPRLFERFFRVDKARSRELGGTGLGLAIVKHLLERHGGTISVRSVPGRGSTFCFTLPVFAAAAELP
ncbi:MAG: two-component system histidine kinase PnpS [Moorellales bacterium]